MKILAGCADGYVSHQSLFSSRSMRSASCQKDNICQKLLTSFFSIPKQGTWLKIENWDSGIDIDWEKMLTEEKISWWLNFEKLNCLTTESKFSFPEVFPKSLYFGFQSCLFYQQKIASYLTSLQRLVSSLLLSVWSPTNCDVN